MYMSALQSYHAFDLKNKFLSLSGETVRLWMDRQTPSPLVMGAIQPHMRWSFGMVSHIDTDET